MFSSQFKLFGELFWKAYTYALQCDHRFEKDGCVIVLAYVPGEIPKLNTRIALLSNITDSNVHGANMGPIWGDRT